MTNITLTPFHFNRCIPQQIGHVTGLHPLTPTTTHTHLHVVTQTNTTGSKGSHTNTHTPTQV